MTLNLYWKKLLRTVNKLQVRERQLIIVTGSIMIVGGFFVGAWHPLYENYLLASAKINQTKVEIEQAEKAIIETKEESMLDANKPFETTLNSLEKDIKNQEYEIETITAALINPKLMNEVFGTLLKNTELEIQTIDNSPAEPIDIKGQDEEGSLLYKHGLSLEMSGTFKDSLKYLQRIEKQNWNLYWDELVFTTKQYPQGKLLLNVHTLSTSDHVLGL